MPDDEWEAFIDLSKATKLKDVAFKLVGLDIAWVALTLKTITSKHRDLRGVLIEGHAFFKFDAWQTGTTAVKDETWEEWADLDRTLIQLWESHAVRAKVRYSSNKREESRELMGNFLLPEATKRGIVELEYRVF